MHQPPLTQSHKQLNHLIQERLNRRFQNNQDLMSTFGKYPTLSQFEQFAQFEPNREFRRVEQTFSQPRITRTTLEPSNSNKGISQDQLQQSISIPATYNNANEYSFVVSNERTEMKRELQPVLIPKDESSQRFPVWINKTESHQNGQTRHNGDPYVPQNRVSYKLANLIKVKTTESVENMDETETGTPINNRVSSPLSHAISVQFQNQKGVADQLNYENKRLNSQNHNLQEEIGNQGNDKQKLQSEISGLKTERNELEILLKNIMEHIQTNDRNELIPKIKALKAKVLFSENRQIFLSTEKKQLEIKFEKTSQENAKLTDLIKSQENKKDQEIDQLRFKGDDLQTRFNQFIATIKTKGMFSEMDLLELPVESSFENKQIQQEIETLKKNLIDKEHDYFVRENDLLQKCAALELHLEKLKTDFECVEKNTQMNNVKSSLDKNAHEQTGGISGQGAADGQVAELRDHLRGIKSELDHSKAEISMLANSNRKKVNKIKKLEVRFFESSIRVVFLSSELERLRGKVIG